MSRVSWAALAAAIALALLPCACASPADTSGPRRSCITEFDPGTDYFPDKSTVTDATNFTLSYHRSYQVLTVKQPYPNASPESYVLVRCGAPAPQLTGELAHARQITVPVPSLYAASTTHLGMLAELDQTDVVSGVAAAQVDVEAVVAARPGVLVTAGTDDPGYARLRDAGIDVLADAEWLEATPLGRAEWVKVFAALTGTEKKAGKLYGKLRDDYGTIAEKASTARPVEVLSGTMHQGTWSMPGGGGYAGQLIADAGGSYPWAGDSRTGSLQLNFESVYAKAGHAPRWLVTSDWKTLDDALAADIRYGQLTAVREGQVWSASTDYWERGVVRPDLVLADLVAILHPELDPDHRFVFYRKLT
ncbi:ABC transporter substrate-binding protein [Mycobacterium branderi]|uniref:ABC transporter substrate-binding protein n=1 Tax=Mycobacterium branderi TaxID=43348 RepID=A0A7I7VZN4_9MYCO|nr:ABC transporter substrate-binding protein [Mycobacterium branderi]MCV7233070.1 ABC transporter substrate-binding protein [Mycobacterium branderi]ORA41168.1 ABC transporter substrate-binding protein [Mycobacterium branderi]BBZ10177.1 ABC transporter substrate-binding protein [Mycobacterium branderi]